MADLPVLGMMTSDSPAAAGAIDDESPAVLSAIVGELPALGMMTDTSPAASGIISDEEVAVAGDLA